MIRRKVKKKKDENLKVKPKKPVVITPQWTYIKNCTHNLKDKTCSLCKLIEIETSKYLQQEYAEKYLRKMENFYKRAEMRYNLLREWSKNQISNYSDVMPLPMGEIILCSSLLNTLTYYSENSSLNTLSDINNYLIQLLEKRNRILEVGDYAATYIQCRIRGLCCRKRITSFLLRRFEYHEETARKGAYFFDKNTGNRYYSTPYLISHERPGSPRTIQRRITYQTNIRDKRMEKYRELCHNEEYTKEHLGGQWKSIETEILLARQLVLLRDLIFALLKELSQKRREVGERPVLPVVPSGKSSDTETMSAENPEFAYWFTLSNPAPPSRQIYLSLALDTDPLEKEEEVLATGIQLQTEEEQTNPHLLRRMSTKRVSINPMATVSVDNNPSESTQIPVMPTFDLNDRLQQLDRRIWEMMGCYSADDMVAKIISCEEIQPTISSCQQIAEDEHMIWKNVIPEDKIEKISQEEKKTETPNTETEEDFRDREVMGQYKRTLSKSTSKSVSRMNSQRGYSFDENENIEEKAAAPSSTTIVRKALSHGLYIPCQLQIHPFYPNRSPSGIIRLFFVDGVISAVSHSSPWVYYPEVWKHRALLIRSICEYAESKPVKALIRALMNRANDLKPKSAPSSAGSQPSSMSAITRGRAVPLPPTTPNPSTPSPTPSNIISVVLPDEKTLFGNYPSLTPCTLTGSEYRTVDQKYRFLRKMKAWKDARRNTASDRKVNVPEESPLDFPPSNPNIPTPSKLTQIPAAENLLGSTIFRLSCAEAPRCSLSEETKYQLASLGGGVAYRSLIKRAANEIDTKMESKLMPPTGNEYTKNVKTPLPPSPPRNLIAIDVHVTFPSEETTHSTQSQTKSDRRASRLQSNAGTSLAKLHAKASSKLTVETHQVIGIFSTATDKPPSALDTSLFTWQQLLKICTKYATLRDILNSPQTGQQMVENEFPDMSTNGFNSTTPLPSISASHSSPTRPPSGGIPGKTSTPAPPSAVDMGATHSIRFSTPLADENIHWTLVTPDSGIYGTKISLGGGLDLQVRLIGKPPEREYLEKTIPKKIRKWIGLKY